MQKKLAICQRRKGRTCRDSHRTSEGIHEIMPARAACRNERLLQRRNQQVTLTVRQESTHCSLCSRFRQWGTIRQQSVRNGPFNNRSSRSESKRNPLADALDAPFSGESVLFTRVECFSVVRRQPTIDARSGNHFLQADLSVPIDSIMAES